MSKKRTGVTIWTVLLAAILGGWALAGTAQAAVTGITLSLSGNTVVADGTSSVTATATVTGDTSADIGSQPVTFAVSRGVPVSFSPPAGCTTAPDGTCSV